MDENPSNKISFKQAQISAQKFNQIAIPHHVGLLKNHRSNIEKCLALGDWSKIKKEEINAVRVIKQLKNLLCEIENLRSKIRNEDIEKFDKMIETGKNEAMKEINEFLELQLKSPSEKSNAEDIDEELSELPESYPPIQAHYQNEKEQLQMKESCLVEFEKLQQEIEDLNSMFHSFKDLVHEQSESVEIVAQNAEEALENVTHGEVNLRQALKYKKAMYPVMGALIGTCVGGPIGLLAGFKAGGLAAIGCGVLGFTGGSVLKSNEIINGTFNPEIHNEKKET